jgi:hypothetical protein
MQVTDGRLSPPLEGRPAGACMHEWHSRLPAHTILRSRAPEPNDDERLHLRACMAHWHGDGVDRPSLISTFPACHCQSHRRVGGGAISPTANPSMHACLFRRHSNKSMQEHEGERPGASHVGPASQGKTLWFQQ